MVSKLCWDRFSKSGQLQAVTSQTLPSADSHYRYSRAQQTNAHTQTKQQEQDQWSCPSHTYTTSAFTKTQRNLLPILTNRIKFILERRNPPTSAIHSSSFSLYAFGFFLTAFHPSALIFALLVHSYFSSPSVDRLTAPT